MSKKPNNVKGQLIYMQFISIDENIKDDEINNSNIIEYIKSGSLLRVRYNQKPELYSDTGVTVYEYEAKEGKGDDAKTVTRYAVAIENAKKAPKKTMAQTKAEVEQEQRDAIKSMQEQGLSDKEIIAFMLSQK